MPLVSRQRGDTLIEVMFATAAGALVIIIALTLMNRGLAQIQVAVESTFVRQAIDGEAEALRYLRGQYLKNPTGNTSDIKLWRDIISSTYTKTTGASTFGTCAVPPKAFVIKSSTVSDPYDDSVGVQNLSINNAPTANSATYAQVGRGIWIEAIAGSVTAGEAKYTDLHVRACWDPPFSSTQKATIGTIVRLYYDGAP